MKTTKMKKYLEKIGSAILMVILFMFLMETPAFSQNSDTQKFKDYEQNFYNITAMQVKYPDLTFDYNYNNNGKLESVTIKGIDDDQDRQALRTWLMDLHNLSDELLYRKDDNGVYFRADENARPSMGKHAFYQELRKNLDYPKDAKDLGIEGVVNLKFTVDRYGDVENLEAKANFDAPDYVKKDMVFEAKRAFKNTTQNWEPAEIDNFNVPEWVILPIKFKIKPSTSLIPMSF